MSRLPTEDRQRQIADAALRIIAEQGLRRFTTAAVAERVGLSEGAVFRHFPNKKAIVTAAIDRVEEILFAGAPEPVDDPLERLGEFVRYRVEMLSAFPGIPRIVFSEELGHAAGAKGAAKVAELKLRSFEIVQRCLLDAHARGMLRTDVPLEHAMLIVQGTLLALVFRDATEDAAEARRRADALWQTVARLLRPSSPGD